MSRDILGRGLVREDKVEGTSPDLSILDFTRQILPED